MNKYFKPLDWEMNDYILYINEPSSIDLSPYLQYIVPEDLPSEDKSSVEEATTVIPFLTPKDQLPKFNPISIPEKDTRGESKITYTPRELDPQEFVSDFTSRYIQKGVNPEVAKIIAVQNLLESRSRDTKYYSQLADQYHNYGGVKWFGPLSDPSRYVIFDSNEERDGVMKKESSAFRVFKDRDDYVDYVIDLLKRMYDLRLDRSYTAEEYLSSLMGNNKSGNAWATASNYADTIRNMARSFKEGGILKFQQAGKFIPDIGDATRVVNWSGLKLTGGRPYNEEYIDYIYNRLLDYGYDYDTVSILVGNILEESGGDPYARDGQFKGILQWEDSRYKIKDDEDPFNELDNQIEYLHNTLDNLTDRVSWAHGGTGSGYMSNVDARNAFLYGKDISTRNHGLSFGYVRPHKGYKDRMLATNNRLNVVNQVLERVK